MFFLLILHISAKNFVKPGGPYQFELQAGQHTIECCGAQGGPSYYNGKISNQGGKGAYVKGILTIVGETKTFYAYVGGIGNSGPKGPNLGGANGGGSSGKDSFDKNDASGGGGGSTDIRFNGKEYFNRVMVAAGGSGAAGTCEGAPGGDLYGRVPKQNGNFHIDYDVSQTKGVLTGNGESGDDNSGFPGSGAGSGWRGGHKTGSSSSFDSDTESWKCVSSSGSSYISGYADCIKHNEIVFTQGIMEVDFQVGNGSVVITTNFICPQNCYSCSSGDKCTQCKNGYVLENGQCKQNCSPGFNNVNNTCVQCKSPCKTCTISRDICQTCIDGYFLHGTECKKSCPDGFYQSKTDNKCLPCSQKCKICDSTADNCYVCADDFILYNNECISNCPTDTARSDNTCQKCHSSCKTCSPTPTDCTSCEDGLNLFNGKCIEICPNKFYPYKGQCVECPSPCETCDSSNICFSCKENFYLYEGKCIVACPSGTVQSGSICIDKNNDN